MNWKVKSRYRYPGPTLFVTDLAVLEQEYPYYRILGKAHVESRVNGVGTCISWVHLIIYSNGRQDIEYIRHWKGTRSPTRKAKAWCEFILNNPPRYTKHKWKTDSTSLNIECREQMRLANMGSMEVHRPGEKMPKT